MSRPTADFNLPASPQGKDGNHTRAQQLKSAAVERIAGCIVLALLQWQPVDHTVNTDETAGAEGEFKSQK